MEPLYAMALPTNEWYLNGIKNRSDEVARRIYQDCFPIIESFILKNSGTRLDAQDIFMDGIIALYRTTDKKDLKLTCKFSTFLFEICKRQWLKKLRRKKYDAGVTPSDPEVFNQVVELDEPIEKTERNRLLREKFAHLTEDCRQVLHLSWHTDYDMKTIAKMMEWTYAYARKRKHLCKEKLIELIKGDSRYDELSE